MLKSVVMYRRTTLSNTEKEYYIAYAIEEKFELDVLTSNWTRGLRGKIRVIWTLSFLTANNYDSLTG
jgi:hypothetical protein